MVVSLLFNVGCDRTHEEDEKSTSMIQLTENSHTDVYFYSSLTQLVQSHRQFRLDYLSTFLKYYNEVTEVDRMPVNGLLWMFDVYDDSARRYHFLAEEDVAGFFKGKSRSDILSYEVNFQKQTEQLKSIFLAKPKLGDIDRVVGVIKELQKTEDNFLLIANDRLNEIAGAKDTKIKQVDMEFYEKAVALGYLKIFYETQLFSLKKMTGISTRRWNELGTSLEVKVIANTIMDITKQKKLIYRDRMRFLFERQTVNNTINATELVLYQKKLHKMWGTLVGDSVLSDKKSFKKNLRKAIKINTIILKKINSQMNYMGLDYLTDF